MKQCPQCGTTYTDATLKYCLADGATLEPLPTSEPTLVRHDAIPGTVVLNTGGEQPAAKSKGWVKFVVAGLALLAVGSVILLVAGFAVYYNLCCGPVADDANTSDQARATPLPTRTPADDRKVTPPANDADRTANSVNENRATPRPPEPTPQPPDSDEEDGTVTATVNSPNDGFLALRSEPDTNRGTLLAKIPHKARVRLEDCERRQVNIAGRYGRWCMVTYQDRIGWVFDGFLDY